MSTATPPAMRIKSHWFKPGAERSPADQGRAVAFTVWRVAHNILKRMRGADFDIDAGEPYFDFLRETLVFLIAVVDRMAHARMDAAAREAFLRALVLHCADTLAGNEADLLGPAPAGTSREDRFLALFNEVNAHYAEFGTEAQSPFMPDFGFLRYLASRLAPTLPPKDRPWVIDQVMAVEAPEAVRTVLDALGNLLSNEPRPARRGARMSGE